MATTRTARILSSVGHELKENPPKTLRGKTGGKRESIRRAILLSKARAEGAHIPKKKG